MVRDRGVLSGHVYKLKIGNKSKWCRLHFCGVGVEREKERERERDGDIQANKTLNVVSFTIDE